MGWRKTDWEREKLAWKGGGGKRLEGKNESGCGLGESVREWKDILA